MNFKQLSFVFLTLISLLIVLHFTLIPVHFVVYFTAGVIFLTILGIQSSRISSGFYLSAICHGNSNDKEIAITFDDGPNEVVTPQVLDILKEFRAKATFFCIGKNIRGREELMKRIVREGHIVGNHTFSHAFMFGFYRAKVVQKELEKSNLIIKNIINKTPRFFRPPYGVTNPSIAKAVKRTKFEVIGWNVRSLDTVIKEESIILKRVTENLSGGDIILFHDTNNRIAEVLKLFLKFTSENGFKIVGLDELVKKSPYA